MQIATVDKRAALPVWEAEAVNVTVGSTPVNVQSLRW